MLHYMGTVQPPRPYPLPKDIKREDNITHLCTNCQTTLWTSKLLDDLKLSATKGQTSFLYTYVNSAETIRRAAIEGCPWCCGLANGIHGQVYLDSVYDAWAKGSPDEDDSDDEEQHDGFGIADSSQRTESDGGSPDADDHDPTGIWDPDAASDTLAYPCEFKITLSFELDSEGLYTFLNIHIESIDLEQEHLLNKITSEKAIHLRYYVYTTGKLSRMENSLLQR
jgi:hypothetical protein